MWSAGCARDATREVIDEALGGENPGRADGAVGPPPVRPEALAIVPTGVPATHAPAVSPEPILPRMDKAFDNRRLPPGVRPGPVATQPADLRHGAPAREGTGGTLENRSHP